VLSWLQAPAAGGAGGTNSVALMSKTEHHEVVCPHIGPVNVFIQVGHRHFPYSPLLPASPYPLNWTFVKSL